MELKILCVHGVGNHPIGGPWEGEWRLSIEEPLKQIDPAVMPVVEFVHLDQAFNRYKITPIDVIQALGKLAKSGVMSFFRQPKGIGDQIRWTAGMVVQWVENGNLRKETRGILERRVREFQPHIIIGHSLGSLVCYDSFSGTGANLLQGRRFVSCGSQIGNPFVIGNFAAGRVSSLPQAEFWYHLYNRDDNVFTAEIRLGAANYSQIETYFDIAGYADPGKNLQGRVNDVFLMSSLLQESGSKRRKSEWFSMTEQPAPVCASGLSGCSTMLKREIRDSFTTVVTARKFPPMA